MTGPIYNRARRDNSEAEIVAAFEACGCSVAYTDKPFDLLVGHRTVSHIVECKTGKAKLTPAQEAFMATWRGEPVAIVRTAAEAVALVRSWETAEAVERRRLDAHRDDLLAGRTEIV